MTKEFAICFSGQPRCIEPAYQDFKKLFHDIDYDIFAHVWDSEELLSSWGHNMGWQNKQTNVYSAKQFIELFQPTDYLIENYKETEFYRNTVNAVGYRNPQNKIWSSYSQFYSIKKSFEVKRQYEEKNQIEYKYTVKYRMDHDVDFDFSNLNTQELIGEHWGEIKSRLDKNHRLILTNPGYDWPDGNGVSNLLAIGNSESMYKYSKVFDHYQWLIQNCRYPDYDEANLKLYLEKVCGLTTETCNINVGVYR